MQKISLPYTSNVLIIFYFLMNVYYFQLAMLQTKLVVDELTCLHPDSNFEIGKP
jgi:hypothetical protein